MGIAIAVVSSNVPFDACQCSQHYADCGRGRYLSLQVKWASVDVGCDADTCKLRFGSVELCNENTRV